MSNDWIDVTPIDKPPGTVLIKGPCWHTNLVPVDSVVTGDVLAQLCTDCDTQLPAGFGSLGQAEIGARTQAAATLAAAGFSLRGALDAVGQHTR